MARRPLAERLATERERVAKLQDNVRRLEAQERKTERAKDTRRKVLLGTLVMDELERDTAMANGLRRWLAERLPDTLTRDHDRHVMARFMNRDGSSEAPTGSVGDPSNDPDGISARVAPSPALDPGGRDPER